MKKETTQAIDLCCMVACMAISIIYQFVLGHTESAIWWMLFAILCEPKHKGG